MLTYEQAIGIILDSVSSLPATRTRLTDALRRILMADIVALIDLPSFDNSQMDGYALIVSDTQTASDKNPTALRIVGESKAGPAGDPISIKPGQCARIFTGAPMTEGANCVIPQEDVTLDGQGNICIAEPVEAKQFVRFKGEDIVAGVVAVAKSVVIRPYEISLLSALGTDSIEVGAVPKVAVISSGDELIEPGSALSHGQVYNSSLNALTAQIVSAGGVVVGRIHTDDDQESTIRALERALEAQPDLIVTSGGVSVGKYDCIKPAIEALGGKLGFTQVSIRPGKPTVFGDLNGKPIFGLPGNPVSSMVTFELFVRPAILRLAGYPREKCCRPLIGAVLTERITHEPGRRSFARGLVDIVDTVVKVTPGDRQRSDQISGMASADALIVIPEDTGSLAAESKVQVMLLD